MLAIVHRDILHWNTFRDLHFLSCSSPVVPGAAGEEGIKERNTASYSAQSTTPEGSAKESANLTPVVMSRLECVGWPRPGAVYYRIYYRTYTT